MTHLETLSDEEDYVADVDYFADVAFIQENTPITDAPQPRVVPWGHLEDVVFIVFSRNFSTRDESPRGESPRDGPFRDDSPRGESPRGDPLRGVIPRHGT